MSLRRKCNWSFKLWWYDLWKIQPIWGCWTLNLWKFQ